MPGRLSGGDRKLSCEEDAALALAALGSGKVSIQVFCLELSASAQSRRSRRSKLLQPLARADRRRPLDLPDYRVFRFFRTRSAIRHLRIQHGRHCASHCDCDPRISVPGGGFITRDGAIVVNDPSATHRNSRRDQQTLAVVTIPSFCQIPTRAGANGGQIHTRTRVDRTCRPPQRDRS
jgi:hypothetical protein